MSAKTSTNGQARKTLADQIDRLDSMLDGLAEGLNDAVKDAVGSAVQQAVQAVMREALANPDLLARLGAAVAPAPPPAAPDPPPPRPAPKATWKQHWAWVRRKMTASVAVVRAECGRRLGQAHRCAAGLWGRLLMLGRLPYSLLTAAVVAVAMGAASWFARPWLAAACGFAALLAVRVRAAWRRLTARDAAFVE